MKYSIQLPHQNTKKWLIVFSQFSYMNLISSLLNPFSLLKRLIQFYSWHWCKLMILIKDIINKWSRSLFPIDFMGEDVVEIVRVNESIIIEIGLHEHLVKILIIKVLSQIFGDLLKLQNSDLSLNNVLITALLTSKEAQTLSTSALLSLSLSLAVARRKNSAKSIPPDWSSSNSARIW